MTFSSPILKSLLARPLASSFDFKAIEPEIYLVSQEDIVRTTKTNRRPDSFTITLPPPNITGVLHIGHAFTSTLQDVMLRFKRQQGFVSFGQPGIDHAGIATQIVVEKQLAAQGMTRQQLGRENFIQKIWEWKRESGGTIVKQLQRLGMSVDWETSRFTMDDASNKAVRRAFVQMYNDGLIYRAERMVNWDPSLKTAVSDLEVVNRIEKGSLWYIRYAIVDKATDKARTHSDCLVIATTRPETLFGDTAIALNPEDPRAAHYVGKFAILPFTGRAIPVIADEAIAMDKGSGVLKVTPAHSFEDFEIGQRHHLDTINILDESGLLNDQVPEQFRGMTCAQARQAVVAVLQEQGLLEKEESLSHSVPYNDRTGFLVEPRVTKQWFVDAKKLADPAIDAVKTGKIRFVPDSWKNTYFEWMNNIQPWCISRQIWWGHRIPVWYAPDGTMFCAETEEDVRTLAMQAFKCEEKDLPLLERDPDVLDTWFSSGLWPFSTQYWPDMTDEQQRLLSKRYPNDLMVTAFDIIFFWVARMIMLGLYCIKDVPFRTVYIHPLVRDAKGQKMSKSKGNVVDPLELMDQYGTDAMRLTLAGLAIPGRDIKISPVLVEGGRNFITKIWNAAKFLELNQCKVDARFDLQGVKEGLNQWILNKLKNFQSDVKTAFESYRFDYVVQYIMKFLRDVFCDVYIEGLKGCLSLDGACRKEAHAVASFVFVEFLKAANPVIPFVTEYLAKVFQSDIEFPLLMVSSEIIPDIPESWKDNVAKTDQCIRMMEEVRSLKGLLNIPMTEKLKLYVEDAEMAAFAMNQKHWLNNLGHISSVIESKPTAEELVLKIVIDGFEGNLQCPVHLSQQSIKEILEKKIGEVTRDCGLLTNKINNQAFKEASPEKWAEDCEKLSSKQSELEKLQKSLESLKSKVES